MGTHGTSSVEIGRYDVASYALTHHAGIRVQQRGVNRDTLDCLLAYGHHEPDHKGCSVVTFASKTLRVMAAEEFDSAKHRASDTPNLYAVVDSDGVVVTTGHRFRRVPRDMSLSSRRPGRSRSPRVLNSVGNPYQH